MGSSASGAMRFEGPGIALFPRDEACRQVRLQMMAGSALREPEWLVQIADARFASN
jgi:hypothetical protein